MRTDSHDDMILEATVLDTGKRVAGRESRGERVVNKEETVQADNEFFC